MRNKIYHEMWRKPSGFIDGGIWILIGDKVGHELWDLIGNQVWDQIIVYESAKN